jgi:hypothetical protein
MKKILRFAIFVFCIDYRVSTTPCVCMCMCMWERPNRYNIHATWIIAQIGPASREHREWDERSFDHFM